MNLDQILNTYDNQKAYEYDDYVEEQEDNEDAYDDYLIQWSRDKRAENYEDTEKCHLNGNTSMKDEDNINGLFEEKDS